MINKFNELDKKYKILIIVSILILLLIILTKIFSKSPEQQLKDYLVKNDYINEYKSSTYSKQVSESNLDEYYEKKEQEENSTYEINSINVKKHTFSKNKRNFMNNTEDTLNEEYDYKTDIITYNYRIVIDNIATGIFKGNYDTNSNEFTCKKEYTYNLDANDDDEIICTHIKDEILSFQNESYIVISDKMIAIMQK